MAVHPAALAAIAILLTTLAGLAVIDLRSRILPNVVVYPGIGAALVSAPLLPAGGYAAAAAGGGLLFVLFAALYFARPAAIGAGDVKLAALIGVALGFPQALPAILLASTLGAVVALMMLLRRRRQLGTKYAYGPYLALGAGIMTALSLV